MGGSFMCTQCVCACVIIPDHKCLGFIGIYQFGFNEITHLQVGAASSPARHGLLPASLRLSALITISYRPPLHLQHHRHYPPSDEKPERLCVVH